MAAREVINDQGNGRQRPRSKPTTRARPRSTVIPTGLEGALDGSSFAGDDRPGMQRQRFSWATLKRDAPAGVITGLMAIPLNVGIAILSDYPIQIAIFTVVVACVIGFATSLVRPGNYIGVPGVAAGLAPVLALGVHRYGMDHMPYLIFLTAFAQMMIWRFRLESYILKAVPPYLVEGLLAGVGLKIAMKFFPYTYETIGNEAVFWTDERIRVVGLSVAAFVLFVVLYRRFKDRSPGVPYIVVIAGGALVATEIDLSMLHFEQVDIRWALPLPDFSTLPPLLHLEMIGYALMLSTVDVIEQVMSNAAIEKIDPLGRKTDSNASLLAIWLANMVSSLFGGMTNLDGLAKSSTNRMAGAVTKMSALFCALVLVGVLMDPELLHHLPNFSLAVLMIFTGWKMIAGLYHVAHEGKYAFGLAIFCGTLVFRLGIFEGLLICLALHSFIAYVVYRAEKLPTVAILKKFVALFGDSSKPHPHATELIDITSDGVSGGLRYRSVIRRPSDRKEFEDTIREWAEAFNRHALLAVVGSYDAGAMLWGASAKELRCGHAAIRVYYERLFELEDVRVDFESGETRQYDGIFIKSGIYAFTHRRRGGVVRTRNRYSFVCKKERNAWYIVEHHSSTLPG